MSVHEIHLHWQVYSGTPTWLVWPCSDQYNNGNKNKEQENNSAHNNFLDCPIQIKEIWNDQFLENSGEH